MARPDTDGSHAAVVVLMEAFGLTSHIRRVCERLANAGYVALAPDLYRGRQFCYDDMDGALRALRALDDAAAMQDVDRALGVLAVQPNVDPGRLGVAGFCMGGRLAFLSGCRHADRLKAVATFYGGGIAPPGDGDRFGRVPPIVEADRLRAPTLLVYGAEDASIAPDEHGRLSQRLSALRRRYLLSVYPGAGHGFCCEDRASYAPDAAVAAFGELAGFFDATLRAPRLQL